MIDKKDDIVLLIRGTSKSFGRSRILDHISLDVKRETVIGLMGENEVGKPTVMKYLLDIYQKDEGSISLNGREVGFSGSRDALEGGIAMAHQELNQYPERNVVNSLLLGRYPVNFMGVIDEGRIKKEVAEFFRGLRMTVNLTQPMSCMFTSQRQVCGIAKAISYNSRVIVLGEPTSSLTVQEVNKPLEMMRMLEEQEIVLIYISRKMDEIFEICDEISVLRGGNLVMIKSTKDINVNELITVAVGRSFDNRFPPVDNIPGDVILPIQDPSTKFKSHLQDVSFDVKEEEIFRLYNLVGAGRAELLETISGVRTRAAGRVYFSNRLMNFSSVRETMERGFVTAIEERKANGLFLKGDFTFNTITANPRQYMSDTMLSGAKVIKATSNKIKIMHIKYMGSDDMISSLSDGNQQRVIFRKWLEHSLQVFMMDELTWGTDVDAKYEIYEFIVNMVKQGKTIIVIFSETPEILGITNRIGVVLNGRLSGTINIKEANQEELLRLGAKYL